MRACRVCGRLYPSDADFCPVDGQALYSATQAPSGAEQDDAGRIGQVLFGRYEVRRVVADGGMGRVYEALDRHETRHVALKVLHPEVAGDSVAVARFKREFEVSKELSSLHVIDVLDFRPTSDGSFALVMEFLYGEELRSALKREKTLSHERVVRLVSQVALALDGAHEKKLVHRDLKPENLFLCQTPEGDLVKVLDFGSVRDNTVSAQKLTVMGTTIGSPFYMPPEQAQGLESLDHRADVWALGAIAYECLTGTVPFKGVNGPSILLEILTKEPTPPSEVSSAKSEDQSVRASIPPGVDRAVLRALKKPVGLRTPSVGQFADELGHAFGLRGAHAEWASMPAAELAAKIEQSLPELLAQGSEESDSLSATDAFFGEIGGLGQSEAPASPRTAVPLEPGVATHPAGVPQNAGGVKVVLIGVGLVVLLAVALVLLI